MKNREITNIRSVLAGDRGTAVGDVEVRPVSLSSMAMLELLGNGCLNQLRGGEVGEVGMYALAEFVWVHAAPEDEVLSLVAGGGFDDAAVVKRAVLKFTGGLGFDRLGELVEVMVREMDAIKAAQVENVRDREVGERKN